MSDIISRRKRLGRSDRWPLLRGLLGLLASALGMWAIDHIDVLQGWLSALGPVGALIAAALPFVVSIARRFFGGPNNDYDDGYRDTDYRDDYSDEELDDPPPQKPDFRKRRRRLPRWRS